MYSHLLPFAHPLAPTYTVSKTFHEVLIDKLHHIVYVKDSSINNNNNNHNYINTSSALDVDHVSSPSQRTRYAHYHCHLLFSNNCIEVSISGLKTIPENYWSEVITLTSLFPSALLSPSSL